MAESYFRQPSTMSAQQHFSQAPSAQIERSTFDRSHAYKTTMDFDELVPVFVDEVLPGDTFRLKATAFSRIATLLKPVMDNMYFDIQFFFVPNRLVWDNWQKFCGERINPDDDPSVYSIPQAVIDLANLSTGKSLVEYFGIPTQSGSTGTINVSALPFRAYRLIYNEWYRDQNLQDSATVLTGDGPDLDYDLLSPFKRGKRHDYFTSCLPWPQKGNPVLIPIAPTAPVRGLGIVPGVGAVPGQLVNETGGVQDTYVNDWGTENPGVKVQEDPDNPGYPLVYAELAEATAVTINDLRQAFQIQKFLERDARGGTRYVEKIFAHFGVKSDDARLQRPEFLGGSSHPINVSPIASTFAGGDVAQGQLAAYGTGLARGGFEKSFTEHGFVIGIASARADLTYQQGVERFWWRKTINEFYWPTFAHLGEQAVLNKEIYLSNAQQNEEVFGYQERYAEYRYKPSRITGQFSSNYSASLDSWHLSQDFAALPVLNASFIESNTPVDRIIAVPDEPHLLVDIWYHFNCTRPMPVYSVPGLIDHF